MIGSSVPLFASPQRTKAFAADQTWLSSWSPTRTCTCAPPRLPSGQEPVGSRDSMIRLSLLDERCRRSRLVAEDPREHAARVARGSPIVRDREAARRASLRQGPAARGRRSGRPSGPRADVELGRVGLVARESISGVPADARFPTRARPRARRAVAPSARMLTSAQLPPEMVSRSTRRAADRPFAVRWPGSSVSRSR